MPSFAEIRQSKFAANRRQALSKRQYAAAKVDRLTGDWLPVNQNVNDLIRSSSANVRARVRQLVRDFPYFARANNILVDFTVGTGMAFQSRVLNPDWAPGSKQPKFDRVSRQKIEDAVSWFMEEADAAGRLHFNELERLSKREEGEAGEYLFVKIYLKDSKRFSPFALQAYEADWLSDLGADVDKGNEIDQGIEYDPMTGAVIAYHLKDPSNYRQTKRIPAEYVVHGFDTQRAGQLRGISPFAAGVLIAHDLSDYLDATIDTAKLAAKYLAMVETPDPAAFQAARAVNGTGGDVGKKIESLENAIIEYMRPGEKITFAKNDTPGATFAPFTQFVLRMAAIATGTTYSLLSGDYSGSSYTTLRGERQDLIKMMAPHQDRHIRHFAAPVIREAIHAAVLAGKLDLPGYWKNPRHYWRCVWIAPGMEPVDPLRESKANASDMDQLTRSPQEIVAKRGRDYEEVLDEIAEAREMAEERSLTMAEVSTALQQNPAKLGASEEGTKSARLLQIATTAAEEALLLADTEEE